MATPTFAAAQIVTPEYIRLPPTGEQDPLFGLTRSYLNLLILPSKENDFHPPVRSSVLRQQDAKTGVRLVSVASLRAYLHDQFRTATVPPPVVPAAARSPELPTTNSNIEFIRLPKTNERDPLFGLSRSFLNQLILPCLENNYQPSVRSHVLRRRGFRTGIRLISVDSLRGYIRAHEESSAIPVEAAPDPASERGDI